MVKLLYARWLGSQNREPLFSVTATALGRHLVGQRPLPPDTGRVCAGYTQPWLINPHKLYPNSVPTSIPDNDPLFHHNNQPPLRGSTLSSRSRRGRTITICVMSMTIGLLLEKNINSFALSFAHSLRLLLLLCCTNHTQTTVFPPTLIFSHKKWQSTPPPLLLLPKQKERERSSIVETENKWATLPTLWQMKSYPGLKKVRIVMYHLYLSISSHTEIFMSGGMCPN